MRQWFSLSNAKHYRSNSLGTEFRDLKKLQDFPHRFIKHLPGSSIAYDDGDLDTWGFEAQRWARVLFLVVREEHHLDSIFEVSLPNLC